MITTDAQAALSGVEEDLATLYRDGTVGRKGVFGRDWVERLHDDMLTAFWAAIQRPRGTVARGRRRWYVEVHPEQISGFVDLISQPWIGTLSEQVLGPEYRFVEIGFDVPFQGCDRPALASGFRLPARDLQGSSPDVPGLQRHRRGCRARYGPVRDRAWYAVGGGEGLGPRHVPAEG